MKLKNNIEIEGFDSIEELHEADLHIIYSYYAGKISDVPEELAKGWCDFIFWDERPERCRFYNYGKKSVVSYPYLSAKESIESAVDKEYCIIYNKSDYSETASFDVDAQNGFSFLCEDELPVLKIDEIDDLVRECNENAEKAKYRYASKDTHPLNGEWTATEENPQYSVVGLPNVDIRWNKHCVVGTYGFELLPGLPEMTDYDFFIYKGAEKNLHPYSPCYHDLKKTISTGIIEKARHDGVKTFILGGLALNFEEEPLCLGSAALDLKDAGFNVIVNLAATRGIGSEKGKLKFLKKLEDKGIIIIENSNEIK
ncbi:isochorismatase family protein [Candidatus Dojkabacteria bacterium]|jgi:nicotinamidase/pyrazinamidase|nr:isochorismatase family protein [Candidatus Dojkabacteria bacterium]